MSVATSETDALVAANKQLAHRWEIEAEQRRRVTASDPAADALIYCASELLEATRVIEAAGLEDTVEDFARHEGVTEATVRRWCRQKKVTARMTSRGWMILRHQRTPADHLKAG